jgi:hypothetical protein
MPPAFAAADPSESAAMRAECVFTRDHDFGGDGGPAAGVTVRFLQVQRRFEDGALAWDEAVEREVTRAAGGEALLGEGVTAPFGIPGGEDACDAPEGATVPGARVVRRRVPLSGSVSVRAVPLPGPWQAARLTVEVENRTGGPVTPANTASPANTVSPGNGATTRDEALPAALVAAHLIITLTGGSFVSMTDPPEWASAEAGACQSVGCWPVLAGPKGSRDTILAAPIILPDYPEVAAESPGELYDGTEIDEILTLRTLALTDDEKAAARATDPRAAALIDRVEAMDAPAMEQLHGTIRAMTGTGAAGTDADPEVPWWDPGADASVSPGTDSVVVAGQRIARGSRVVLRPGVPGHSGRRADAQDMFLAGREAVVEAVLQDVDGAGYLAVSLADDPGADIQAAHGRFRYFAPDEVEPR